MRAGDCIALAEEDEHRQEEAQRWAVHGAANQVYQGWDESQRPDLQQGEQPVVFSGEEVKHSEEDSIEGLVTISAAENAVTVDEIVCGCIVDDSVGCRIRLMSGACRQR